MKIKNILWPIFIFFSVGVGIYPFLYFIADLSGGLLSAKDVTILNSQVWNFAFYTHIITGGISLLTGWSQFSKKIRSKNISLHRILGKIYLLAVLMSGLTGLYIAIHANGGPIAQFGFGTLSVLWLYTGWRAYSAIKSKNIEQHQNWMIRNYALSWAGVMLRIWLPLFQFALGLEFIIAYQIISWLCWVPNLIVAQQLIKSKS
jgi:uncharacterized membrane protein